MNMTRKPATSVQVKLIPRRFWLTRSASFTANGSDLAAVSKSSDVNVPGAIPARSAPEPSWIPLGIRLRNRIGGKSRDGTQAQAEHKE